MTFFRELDSSIFFFLHNFVGVSPFLDTLILVCAHYLPYALFLVAPLLLLRAGYPWRKKFVIGSTLLTTLFIAHGILIQIIRHFYQRPRPFLTHEIQQLFSVHQYSFPSGHATLFFALSAALYMYNKRWGIYFFIASVVVCVARVMAGVHYPSDIIGGMIIGVATAYVSVKYLAPQIEKIIKKSK